MKPTLNYPVWLAFFFSSLRRLFPYLFLRFNWLDGSVVANGLQFRNVFHVEPKYSSTLFVPCGGRPESVDVNNMHLLINDDGTPKFKYIVEGANLFFTQVGISMFSVDIYMILIAHLRGVCRKPVFAWKRLVSSFSKTHPPTRVVSLLRPLKFSPRYRSPTKNFRNTCVSRMAVSQNSTPLISPKFIASLNVMPNSNSRLSGRNPTPPELQSPLCRITYLSPS